MSKAKKKRVRAAWNRFGDLGRAVLVGTATLLPERAAAKSPRITAGVSLLAIKYVTEVLKKAVPEPRPDGEDNESFPSEHAAQCVAAAMIIRREYPGMAGALASGLAAAVSISRILGKKHHPRDVAAGALIGAATVWIELRLHGPGPARRTRPAEQLAA
jgi:membrane-associated phospholipid phosphatase